jgi:hypothetical protein
MTSKETVTVGALVVLVGWLVQHKKYCAADLCVKQTSNFFLFFPELQGI